MIEKFPNTEPWFKPVFFSSKGSGEWQIAFLNHAPPVEQITQMERHIHTDEVFIHLKGKSILITMDRNEKPSRIDYSILEEETIYNIPKGVWHHLLMKKNSSVYIVEKKDTHKHDVEFLKLSAAEIEEIHNEIRGNWID